ncbi:hypothetical protein NMG60_11025739 [Bertholletia excelsa]
MVGGGGKVEVMNIKGCSRLFGEISSSLSFRNLHSFEPMSPASSSTVSQSAAVRASGPFSGLVICVTGLSKEARKQVKDATERLGGQYSPNLHPQCTHLVVQSFRGHKLEHALKHGLKNGLFVVTLGWFVDSVRRNVRLNESLYSVKSPGENGIPWTDLNQISRFADSGASCLPVTVHEDANKSHLAMPFLENESKRSMGLTMSGLSLYIDKDISPELRRKVVESAAAEGATFIDQWLVGSNVSHVVCEGSSVQKYIGHSSNIVTPLWVLKSAKEKHIQRLLHMSTDMAQQVGIMLDNALHGIYEKGINGENYPQDAAPKRKTSHEERQRFVNLAKNAVRKRRCSLMQTCQTPIRPINPSSLLDSISWSISEPTSTASVYMDSFCVEDNTSVSVDAKWDVKESEPSFVNFSRPLMESERTELVFKNHFLTILFPVDRYAELGPSSRTFFSDTGFTCLQVLDFIFAFYQENMPVDEVEVAIHTDSRHADRLRSLYASKETAERGCVAFKRIDFLGSRKSFEMLKRVNGDNSCNVYELLLTA